LEGDRGKTIHTTMWLERLGSSFRGRKQLKQRNIPAEGVSSRGGLWKGLGPSRGRVKHPPNEDESPHSSQVRIKPKLYTIGGRLRRARKVDKGV